MRDEGGGSERSASGRAATGGAGDAVDVRPAREDELPAVMNVIDGALLEVDAEAVAERLGDDAVLVAVEDGRVLGACVVVADDLTGTGRPEFVGPEARDVRADVGAHLAAVAVRPGRRGGGIGSSLVAAAADRWGPLSATYDARLRSFYEPLGFDVVAVDGERCLGVRRTAGESPK